MASINTLTFDVVLEVRVKMSLAATGDKTLHGLQQEANREANTARTTLQQTLARDENAEVRMAGITNFALIEKDKDANP